MKALGHKVKSLWGSDPDKPYNIWDPAGGRIEGLRSDRGGEFIGEAVLTFCKNAGIRQTFTGPYAPQATRIFGAAKWNPDRNGSSYAFRE